MCTWNAVFSWSERPKADDLLLLLLPAVPAVVIAFTAQMLAQWTPSAVAMLSVQYVGCLNPVSMPNLTLSVLCQQQKHHVE